MVIKRKELTATMQFAYLEHVCKKWRDILVIGRTIEGEERCHIIGMTLEEDAKLYILEPAHEPEETKHLRRTRVTNRTMLKRQEESRVRYLDCEEVRIGKRVLKTQGGSGTCLKYVDTLFEEIGLFYDMLRAGWEVPEWLKEIDWENLQLVTLKFSDVQRLPKYTPDMPVVLKHRPGSIRHWLEKTVTLEIGKPRRFQFTDENGEKVWCYINQVELIDMWKQAEEQFCDPNLEKRFSKEDLREMKRQYLEVLEQKCPKGMYFVGVEYECSRDVSLQFYMKEYLSAYQENNSGSAVFLVVRLQPDKKTGVHGLPLKGCALDGMPVTAETTKIPAELLFYYEKKEAWEEYV
ncbi:MAG: hypothetical protein NC180_07020 [Muribaculaceae bacterium]|nr:hypothetical protein [Roseburia sp.]MCM1430018.1 hypothetical protein [Muribaculaceae bacterium]MCM1492955.1 hypothetical protein [Muribaculaceae bacterium]